MFRGSEVQKFRSSKVQKLKVGNWLLPARMFWQEQAGLPGAGLLVVTTSASPNVIPKEVRLRELLSTSLPLKQKRVRSFIVGDSRPYQTVRSGGSRSFLPRNDGLINERRSFGFFDFSI